MVLCEIPYQGPHLHRPTQTQRPESAPIIAPIHTSRGAVFFCLLTCWGQLTQLPVLPPGAAPDLDQRGADLPGQAAGPLPARGPRAEHHPRHRARGDARPRGPLSGGGVGAAMEGGVGRSFEASSLHPFSTLLLARARKMSDTQRLVEFVPHPFLSAALSEADGEGGDRHDGVHEAVLLRGGPPGHPIRAQCFGGFGCAHSTSRF